VGDEVLILDTQSNQVHQLNRTASFIWRSLGEVNTPECLGRMLSDQFDVAEEQATADVVVALAGFESAGLVGRELDLQTINSKTTQR